MIIDHSFYIIYDNCINDTQTGVLVLLLAQFAFKDLMIH